MGYSFPPDLQRLVRERMTAGGYQSEDDLLFDAMAALADLEMRESELRTEIQRRIKTSGSSLSQLLDRAAFRAEARAKAYR